MSSRALNAQWLAGLRSRAAQAPLRPRVPLWWQAACIGSVEPDFFARMTLPTGCVAPARRDAASGWEIHGELTATLRDLAFAMRDAGIAHAWRDEQLAVMDEGGRVLGSVERAVVRPLGIATSAVHLAGFSPDGRHWVQRRSLTKANDPGLWDTLMGGMVPASDSLAQALARETWEEAGLKLEQLAAIERGGCIETRRPTGDSGPGYVVERIDWFRCVVPDGVVPVNQDGEVAEFKLMGSGEVLRLLQRDEFTTEAALILVEAGI